MRFREWLLSFPMPDGKPATSIVPGMITFVAIALIIVIAAIGLTRIVP